MHFPCKTNATMTTKKKEDEEESHPYISRNKFPSATDQDHVIRPTETPSLSLITYIHTIPYHTTFIRGISPIRAKDQLAPKKTLPKITRT